MVMVGRMSTSTKTSHSAIAIISYLFSHGLARMMQSMAQCEDGAFRLEAVDATARILRSGKFITEDLDMPIVFASPEWQLSLEQLYYIWVDVMDGKVVNSRPTMSVASQMVRSGFAAVFMSAIVDAQSSDAPMSAECMYEIYAHYATERFGEYRIKPFAKVGPAVRRAWLAVATAIARLNGQFDPAPVGVLLPDVVAALGLVTERFGPPKLIAA